MANICKLRSPPERRPASQEKKAPLAGVLFLFTHYAMVWPTLGHLMGHTLVVKLGLSKARKW